MQKKKKRNYVDVKEKGELSPLFAASCWNWHYVGAWVKFLEGGEKQHCLIPGRGITELIDITKGGFLWYIFSTLAKMCDIWTFPISRINIQDFTKYRIKLWRMFFFMKLLLCFFLSYMKVFFYFSLFLHVTHSTFFSHLISTALAIKKKKRWGRENPHSSQATPRWTIGFKCLSSACQAAGALRRCFDLSRAAAIVRMRLSVKREEKLERSRPAVSSEPE